MKLVVPLAKDDLQRYRLSTDWPQPWLAFVAIIQSFFVHPFASWVLKKTIRRDGYRQGISGLETCLVLTGEGLPGFRYSMSYLTVSRFQHLRPAVLHQPEEDEDGDFESAGFSKTSPASTCAFHLQPRDAGDS